MNVAVFASSFFPHVGGVEEVCRQLAGQFGRAGVGVCIFTNRWPRTLTESERIEGVQVHRLAMRVPAAGWRPTLSYALTSGSVRRRIARLLREFRPDVINIHCVSVNAWYGQWASRDLSIPLVVTLHGELTMDASRLFERSAWAKRVLHESLASAHAVTACSRQTLDEAQSWHGQPFGARSTVIHNGVTLTELPADPYPYPKPYILGIGRHVEQKGFDLLLRAMKLLATDPAFEADLILAGDGVEHDRLRALANELGLGPRVVFTGSVDHATALRLFAGCAFFVLPSRIEPFGIVNLEAMAAGKAVIATRVGGVPELVVEGQTGILVPPNNIAALASAIARVAGDLELRTRLGAAGRARATQFDWAAVMQEYLAVYRAVMA